MAFMELQAKVSLDGSAVGAGLRKVESAVASARNKMNAVGSSGIAQAFGVAAVLQFARSTMELGGQIADTSKRLGISAEEVQKWNFAATQSGSTIEDVTSFFEKMSKAKRKALDGDAKMIANFKKLGVSLEDLKKKSLSEIGLKVGGTIQMGDIQALFPHLQAVGGRGAGAMVAPMKQGLQAAMAAAPIMSNEQIEELDKAGDEIDRLMLQLRVPMATALSWAVLFFEYFVDGIGLIKAAVSDYFSFIFAKVFDGLAMLKGDFSGANFKDATKNSEFSKRLDEWNAKDAARESTAELRKQKEEEAKKAAAAGKIVGDDEESATAVNVPQSSAQKIQRDSLSQIGGFTFARDQEIINVAKAQVDLLSKISANTEQLKVLKPVTDGL